MNDEQKPDSSGPHEGNRNGGHNGSQNGNREFKNLPELRFDYAWKWFEFHARQRTTLLNFFLIIVGVFFAASG